ncbi:MAG TPA: UbiA prenyltransferase family protein [Alphaproteobacteria bacterium]
MSVQIPALLRLARPEQWIKNGFVAAPLFFTPGEVNARNLALVAAAVVAFSLLSSAIYVFNDWCDREADRLHPAKRLRPLASGAVSPQVGLAWALVLCVAGAAIAEIFLPPLATALALAYVLMTVLYSARLKHVAILDVLIVATGFVLRIEVGSAAIGVAPTVWIVVCTFLLALFLALAKRRDDLVKFAKLTGDAHRPALGAYNLQFVDTAIGVVLAALLVSYLIYTTDAAVIAKFHTDKLYFTAPFVAAGVLRYLQIALVEQRSGSPTDLVLTDRFLILSILGWIAVFAALLYG